MMKRRDVCEKQTKQGDAKGNKKREENERRVMCEKVDTMPVGGTALGKKAARAESRICVY